MKKIILGIVIVQFVVFSLVFVSLQPLYEFELIELRTLNKIASLTIPSCFLMIFIGCPLIMWDLTKDILKNIYH